MTYPSSARNKYHNISFNLNIAKGYYKAIMNDRVNDSFWTVVLRRFI